MAYIKEGLSVFWLYIVMYFQLARNVLNNYFRDI
jgi:hypothetical protein